MRRVLAALAVVVALILVGLAGKDLLDRRRTVREIRDLRDRVYQARVSADSCRNELAYEERLFRRFDTVVDSLRRKVRDYERMDERGVPESEYEEYLRHFEGYNDSVAAWRQRAAALRTDEAACRALIEEHNARADTLRRRLDEEGMGGNRS